MKDHVRSIKLMGAIGLLLASAALGAPNADRQTEAPEQPQAKRHIVVTLPNGDQTAELDDSALQEMTPLTLKRVQVHSPAASFLHPDKALLVDAEHARVSIGKYWIGVSCGPIPAVLHEHLDIPVDHGMLVGEVVPGGPAAKAGLVKNDLLLSANKKPLRQIVDVVRVVEEVKGKPISFELIRKGNRITVEITPEQNPHWKTKKDQTATKRPPYAELDQVYQWFERHYPGHSVRPRMRLRFMHPGMILPPDALMHPTLPGSMSITIMKKGNKPTEITVARGKDVWKVDEKGLDSLPKDIRPHVERMLHGLVAVPDMTTPRLDYMPEWIRPKTPSQDQQVKPRLRDRFEERMEQMNQRLNEIRGMVEGLYEKKGPEEKK